MALYIFKKSKKEVQKEELFDSGRFGCSLKEKPASNLLKNKKATWRLLLLRSSLEEAPEGLIILNSSLKDSLKVSESQGQSIALNFAKKDFKKISRFNKKVGQKESAEIFNGRQAEEIYHNLVAYLAQKNIAVLAHQLNSSNDSYQTNAGHSKTVTIVVSETASFSQRSWAIANQLGLLVAKEKQIFPDQLEKFSRSWAVSLFDRRHPSVQQLKVLLEKSKNDQSKKFETNFCQNLVELTEDFLKSWKDRLATKSPIPNLIKTLKGLRPIEPATEIGVEQKIKNTYGLLRLDQVAYNTKKRLQNTKTNQQKSQRHWRLAAETLSQTSLQFSPNKPTVGQIAETLASYQPKYPQKWSLTSD